MQKARILAFYLILISFLVGIASPAWGQIESGLVAHWTFNDTLVDAEGNANLTFGGAGSPAYVAGRAGQAIALDGDNYLNSGMHAIAGTSLYAGAGNPFTVAFHFRSTDAVGVIVASAVGSSSDWNFTAGIVNGQVSIRLRGVATLSPGSNYDDGEWHHLAVVWDTSDAVLYLDGASVAALTVGSAAQNVSEPIILGANTVGAPQNFYVGDIDDARIYDRPLSTPDVQALEAFTGAPPVSGRRRVRPFFFR